MRKRVYNGSATNWANMMNSIWGRAFCKFKASEYGKSY